MTDEDLVINYCLQNKVSKPVIDELLKRRYTSLEALRLVDIEDLDCPKIRKGQPTSKEVPDLENLSIPQMVVVVLLFYVHGKHLRSCRDGQLT